MIYKVERSEAKYRFDLSELAPYHVGQGLRVMMLDALYKGIPLHYADHVVTHTGGKTVLDCTVSALGLEGAPRELLAPTCKALREFGNQSSCSFFFAFDNLVNSGTVHQGDVGLFVTMGPGAGLEMALWTAGPRFTAVGERVKIQPVPLLTKLGVGRTGPAVPIPEEQENPGDTKEALVFLDAEEDDYLEAAGGQGKESESWFAFKVQRSRSTGWSSTDDKPQKTFDADDSKKPQEKKADNWGRAEDLKLLQQPLVKQRTKSTEESEIDKFGEDEDANEGEEEGEEYFFPTLVRSRSTGWGDALKN